MINAEIKGKYSTFVVPIKDEAFANFKSWAWNGRSVVVTWRAPYDGYDRNSVYLGWQTGGFPDCCGASTVYAFTPMVYGALHEGLKDSHTKMKDNWAQVFRDAWEPWYNENVTPDSMPAIGIIPSNISKDGKLEERAEFYTWLRTKGKHLAGWKNMIYSDAWLDAYLFVHKDNKALTLFNGSAYQNGQKPACG